MNLLIMKKVSFDFDSTLDRPDVQRFAKELVSQGQDVWVVTSRVATESALLKGWHWIGRQNEQLYMVAEDCGIPRDKIVFTEYVDKIEFLKGKGFTFHLDDDEVELELISLSEDSCEPVDVKKQDWEILCRELLLN
jgi:hypothetical protein